MAFDLEAGDIVYCKGVAKFGTTGSLEFRAGRNEHYLCLLLGISTDRRKLPTMTEVFALASNIGVVNLDDVTAAIGEEASQKIADYVKAKYYPTKEADAPTDPK